MEHLCECATFLTTVIIQDLNDLKENLSHRQAFSMRLYSKGSIFPTSKCRFEMDVDGFSYIFHNKQCGTF